MVVGAPGQLQQGRTFEGNKPMLLARSTAYNNRLVARGHHSKPCQMLVVHSQDLRGGHVYRFLMKLGLCDGLASQPHQLPQPHAGRTSV